MEIRIKFFVLQQILQVSFVEFFKLGGESIFKLWVCNTLFPLPQFLILEIGVILFPFPYLHFYLKSYSCLLDIICAAPSIIEADNKIPSSPQKDFGDE